MPTLVTFNGTDDEDVLFIKSVLLLEVDMCFTVPELAETVSVDAEPQAAKRLARTRATSTLKNHIPVYLLTSASNSICICEYNTSTYSNNQKKTFFYNNKDAMNEKKSRINLSISAALDNAMRECETARGKGTAHP